MTEIELKLALSPADVAAFRRAAPLAGVRPRRRKLTSIYYDTPEFALEDAGVALRLRRSGGRWIQSVKGGAATGTGGLHERGEWERPRPDASIDPGGLEGTPIAALEEAATLPARLKPAFTVALERETWDLEPEPGTRVEVALDRGKALAAGRAAPVCEVEIEILQGDRAAAFALADSLLDSVRLRPTAVTKAERGYRLLRDEPLRPMKSSGVQLAAAMTPVEAARAVIAAALAQMQANEEGLLATSDPEFVHQARVALRRLRSALRMFRDVLPPEARARWREASGEAARALGEARDWDVLATETLPPLLRAFGNRAVTRSLAARAQARRRKARVSARALLASPGYARFVLDLARWLAEPPAAPPAGTPALADYASRIVRRRHRRLLADAQHLARLSPAERHAIRIDAKRLRYGVDGFASLFRARRVEDYLGTLEALQDVLGNANDAATAARLLKDLRPPRAFAAFSRGWLAARAEGEIAAVAALVRRLASVKRFWRRKGPPGAPGR
jgi:inorganic triphosphatase YgiF